MSKEDFLEIAPKAAVSVPSAAQIATGVPVPPVRLLQVMSPSDWEAFTEEWLSFHRKSGAYQSIRRYSGPGDLGLDVVAFVSSQGFSDDWDSYQCKHYDHPLEPNDIIAEIGKLIFHSFNRTPPFNQSHRIPRRHVFVPPQGVGITVGRLLKDAARLQELVRSRWDDACVPKIGKNIKAPLADQLLAYFDDFDFSIFEDRSGVELIEEHAQTVFYAPRFGGGLPPRDEVPQPPMEPSDSESTYLRKLLEAYGEQVGYEIKSKSSLGSYPELEEHYDRQRVLFYCAESLRNFARDRTPPRTFDSLQDDIYHGVIDTCQGAYPNALERLRATVSQASRLDVSGNALVSVTRVPDKQGICHQLANDDRLSWK